MEVLEEYKERYKGLTVSKRVMIMAVLGLIYPGYFFYENLQGLEEKKKTAASEKASAKKKFLVAKEKSKNLPLLEEKHMLITSELRLFQDKLPNYFYMDDILYSIASIAEEVGISIKSFQPGEEKVVKGEYSYSELEIALSISGSYKTTAVFFDGIVGLDKMLHIRDITMAANRTETSQETGKDKSLVVDTQFKLVVFRSS